MLVRRASISPRHPLCCRFYYGAITFNIYRGQAGAALSTDLTPSCSKRKQGPALPFYINDPLFI